MTTITLTPRPKTVDLEELFNLRLKIALAQGSVNDVTAREPLEFGQQEVTFPIKTPAIIDSALIYRTNGELYDALVIRDGPLCLSSGDTVVLRIYWN